MPLWFGAKDAPMYTPKTASCTPMKANAMPSGQEVEDDGDVGDQSRDEHA